MLTIEQIQKTVTAYFKDKPVKKVYLFGSYARGEADEKSDVDLLVRYDDSNDLVSLFDILRMKIGLEERLHKNVELVEEGRVFKGFLPYIKNDLVRIYEV